MFATNRVYGSHGLKAAMSLAQILRLWLPLVLMASWVSAASGDVITLNSLGSNWGFGGTDHVISGEMVDNVTPQSAAFEAYYLFDRNNSGAWDGGDARRRSIGTYDNGLFGLYTMSENWGAHNGIDAAAGAHGKLRISDVMITSLDPSAPDTIATSLNFFVSGAMSHFDYYANDTNYADLDMRITLNGSVFNGEYRWAQNSLNAPQTTVTGLATQIAGGEFSEDFSSTITTGMVNVPVDTPFMIELDFSLKSTTAGLGSAYHGVTFDAMNTAGFLPGASIFNLPNGYTANSAGGIIVNNRTSAVPEPGSLGLISVVGCALMLLRRRRNL